MPAQLVADPASFPEVSEVHGLVEIMTEVDVVFDLLKAVRAAQFGVPKDHPDLVPHKEAARLAELLQASRDDDDVKGKPADFLASFDKSIAAARALATGLSGKGTLEEHEKRYKAVERSCKECHTAHRDNVKR
jgi:cytochrome c556